MVALYVVFVSPDLSQPIRFCHGLEMTGFQECMLNTTNCSTAKQFVTLTKVAVLMSVAH